ncbi:hypothetical protein L1887_11575 [Cichorium endivia]|nr:hypothetical protein L1887_11575 [Cichorium endivia]
MASASSLHISIISSLSSASKRLPMSNISSTGFPERNKVFILNFCIGYGSDKIIMIAMGILMLKLQVMPGKLGWGILHEILERLVAVEELSADVAEEREDESIRNNPNFVDKITCSSNEPPAETGLTPQASGSLKIGTPIIIVEAPKMLKTAASVPCLRVNSGLVKAGDVGRIMSRKPKDVWAVRLAIGTYLIDGIYFKPLQLDDNN